MAIGDSGVQQTDKFDNQVRLEARVRKEQKEKRVYPDAGRPCSINR